MYIKDVNSPAALRYLAKNRSTLILSGLTELEFFNAAERRVGRKHLIRSEVETAYASFKADVRAGLVQIMEIDAATWEETKALILRHTASVGCRTADALHLAAAISSRADSILTFDVRRKELAIRLKLATN